MFALQLASEGESLRRTEVEKPAPGPGEVLVRIRATSLCGSDLHHIEGHTTPGTFPITLGHEAAGVVAETGAGVDRVAVGDHVVVHYIISCGACEACSRGLDNQCTRRTSIGNHVDGTFAEFIAVPAENALVMDDEVPFSWGSISACAVSTGFHALEVADIDPGDTVVVFGAGGVGLHAVLWSSFFGAGSTVAVDLVEDKLDIAREHGATHTINPAEADVETVLENEFGASGVDVAIECSGSPRAMEQAIASVNGDNQYASGTVVSVGLQTEPFEVEYWGIREGSISVSGDHTRAELQQIISLMEADRIDLSPSITHRFPFDEYEEAVEVLKAEDESVGRIVLELD